MTVSQIKKELKKNSSVKNAKSSERFFKTGKGEYGERDVFIGVSVPNIRKAATKFADLDLKSVYALLSSKIHEERFCAIEILICQYQKGDDRLGAKIAAFYLQNRKYINNWDLVDRSAPCILGHWLRDKDKSILYKLARSTNLWEKRMAIVSTLAFIRNDKFSDTFKIAEILLNDTHDLIHKAVGWMLREVGNKERGAEEKFLKKHYKNMPRTMLRYAIEKFAENLRQKYLKGGM